MTALEERRVGVRRPGFQVPVLPLSRCGPQQAFGLSRPQFPHLANGSVGLGDPTPPPPDKEMATHSSTLAWEIQWTEEPGGVHGVAKSWTRLEPLSMHMLLQNIFMFFKNDFSLAVLSLHCCESSL